MKLNVLFEIAANLPLIFFFLKTVVGQCPLLDLLYSSVYRALLQTLGVLL